MKNKVILIKILPMMMIFIVACKTENVNEPSAIYPIPLDSNFSFTWEYFYKNEIEEQKNWIKDIEFGNQNQIWIATYFNGIIKIDGSILTEFNTSNSGICCDTIWDIAIDKHNHIWIGTQNGLSEYDGLNWVTYNQSNSPLPVKHISSVAIDAENMKWMGCGNATEGGLLCLKDSSWELFTSQNSILPTGIIEKVYIDNNNTKWIGTGFGIGTGGLIKIKNNNWILYDTNNSVLPYHAVNCITSDMRQNMWFGMNAWIYSDPHYLHGSLVKYDGNTWVEHKPANSENSSNRLTSIVADNYGYIWAATSQDFSFDYEVSIFDGKKWVTLSLIDDTFPHAFILDMKVDTQNNIWIASGEGLIKIVPHY